MERWVLADLDQHTAGPRTAPVLCGPQPQALCAREATLGDCPVQLQMQTLGMAADVGACNMILAPSPATPPTAQVDRARGLLRTASPDPWALPPKKERL